MEDGDHVEQIIGDAIKAARIHFGIPMETFAKMLSVTPVTLRKLERGRGKISLLIDALVALDRLDLLEGFEIAAQQFSPVQAYKAAEQAQRRVRRSNV